MHSVEEVLVDEIYKFEANTISPTIIDCGASIGLSIIYLKRLFPNSSIIAFEPDKKIYEVCKNNINLFKFSSVEIIDAAVWVENGITSFLPDDSLGGKIVSSIDVKKDSSLYAIKTIRLKDYITKKIDFLKIDIEGAELDVLRDCQQELRFVDKMFVEDHSDVTKPQQLQELLDIISKAGFRYYIKHAMDYMQYPFVDYKRSWNLPFDLQLNVFAYRI